MVQTREFITRREDRFAVRGEEITLTLSSCDGELNCQATLLDLSSHGCKIVITDLIRLHSQVVLEIVCQALDLRVAVAGDVCWIQPALAPSNGWQLGCSFTGLLPPETLATFARFGHLDRRQDNRRRTQLAIGVHCELGEGAAMQATIEDYSVGGCRLRTERPLSIDERVLIQGSAGERLVRIPTRAVWSMHVDDQKHLTGCSFLNRAGFEQFDTLAKSQQSDADARSMLLRPWFWIGLIFALAWSTAVWRLFQ